MSMSGTPPVALLATAALGAGAAGLYLLRSAPSPSSGHKAIASPRETLLPQLSPEAAAALPYPPNLFPGARDVDTPYGSMRVYEWGPPEGKKVVMVPGDTTPAPIFAHVAHALVDKGLRVMIVDTWGRGYTDAPLEAPYNSRLFVQQIFFAIASSSLAWTGAASEGFALIGFSLGGAVVMSFAATFPYLVTGVILLAPGGLIRALPPGYASLPYRLRAWMPTRYLRYLTGQVLGADTRHAWALPPAGAPAVTTDTLDLPALWQWQFDQHRGFVYAFIDTTQNAPLQHQHAEWRRACDIIRGATPAASPTGLPVRLRGTRLLVICGDADGVVVAQDVRNELARLIPEPAHLVFRTVPGGHGFPIPSGPAVAQHIIEFWGL